MARLLCPARYSERREGQRQPLMLVIIVLACSGIENYGRLIARLFAGKVKRRVVKRSRRVQARRDESSRGEYIREEVRSAMSRRVV